MNFNFSKIISDRCTYVFSMLIRPCSYAIKRANSGIRFFDFSNKKCDGVKGLGV